MGVVGLLLFCIGFFGRGSAQEEPGNQITFKTICENGTIGCTMKENCSSVVNATGKTIRSIDDQTLVGCAQLELLGLNNNNISEISKNSFRDQQNLRDLYLYENQIKVLTSGVFDSLTNLTRLALQRNFIEVIADSLFLKNVKLEQLSLCENNIVAIGPNTFQNLSKLEALWLFGNPCMHPNVTWKTNLQKLGTYFSEEI
jgi:Leucine-rich repeat (LRR) protein